MAKAGPLRPAQHAVPALRGLCVEIRRRAARRSATNWQRHRRRWCEGGTCLLFACGNCLAHGPEQFITPRCLADHQFQVLRKKIAFVDQVLSLLPHLFEVPRSARERSSIDRRGSPFVARSSRVAGNGIVAPIRLINLSGAPICGWRRFHPV
jgi:hypothetical protein